MGGYMDRWTNELIVLIYSISPDIIIIIIIVSVFAHEYHFLLMCG